MRMQVQSRASLSGLRIWRGRELWCRLAAAALIGPLAWELPYAAGAALKGQKKREKCLCIYSHIYVNMYTATLENRKENSVDQRNS